MVNNKKGGKMEKRKPEKAGNNQEKPETRGRKPLQNKSVNIHWRCPYDIHQLLEKRQAEIEKEHGVKVPVSKVLEGIVKNSVI